MDEVTRRRILASGVAVAGALAGCSTRSGEGGGDAGTDPDDGSGTDGASDSGSAAGDATTPRHDVAGDALALDTLAVGGSPGSTVPVRPDGTVTLLDFFGTWCAPCKPQMDHLRTVRSQFPDVHMLSITWESDESVVADFWREYDGTWPVATDPKLKTGQKYGIDRIPTIVVFDADGRETWRHVGLVAAEDIAGELRAAGATEG